MKKGRIRLILLNDIPYDKEFVGNSFLGCDLSLEGE